jgi:hypothetical protein
MLPGIAVEDTEGGKGGGGGGGGAADRGGGGGGGASIIVLEQALSRTMKEKLANFALVVNFDILYSVTRIGLFGPALFLGFTSPPDRFVPTSAKVGFAR